MSDNCELNCFTTISMPARGDKREWALLSEEGSSLLSALVSDRQKDVFDSTKLIS